MFGLGTTTVFSRNKVDEGKWKNGNISLLDYLIEVYAIVLHTIRTGYAKINIQMGNNKDFLLSNKLKNSLSTHEDTCQDNYNLYYIQNNGMVGMSSM